MPLYKMQQSLALSSCNVHDLPFSIDGAFIDVPLASAIRDIDAMITIL